MPKTRLILVGGFLGAGKTTLLAQAAKRFEAEGLRVGMITNDQADDLVDTAVLAGEDFDVREVSGGCFCCRFGCLLSASDLLIAESDSDVLLAEPVGSCTDISATVLQPLKEYYGQRFDLAPFSVLVDPARALEVLSDETDSPLPENVLYILRTQLAEADLIVLNKVDLLGPDEIARIERLLSERFPGPPVLKISAREGRGIDQWLAAVSDNLPAGARVTDVDYDTYADGEAALGWLNATVKLSADRDVDWQGFCRDLLDGVRREFAAIDAEVAHVKLLLVASGGQLAGNLTSTSAEPVLRGELEGVSREATLTFNARVHLGPQKLREVFEQSLSASAAPHVRTDVVYVDSFSPARPEPTHRFETVATAGGAAGRRKEFLRKAVAALLLAFVGASAAFLITREIREALAGQSGAVAQNSTLAPLANGVTVYVFHPRVRCASCRDMQQWTRAAFDAVLGDRVRSGDAAWRVADFENARNAELVTRFGVFATTVVLVEMRGGEQIGFRRLDDSARYLHSGKAFGEYVRKQLETFPGGD